MERKDLVEIIKAVLAEVCGVEMLEENRRLKEDYGLDSLSLVAVIVGIEDKTGVAFDDGELDPAKLITAKDLVDLTWKSV